MRIRHLTAAANVDPDGFLIDPLLVRHGILVAGRIAALAGPIDPQTHLNLAFAEHHLDDCLVAEALVEGALLVRQADRFATAAARPAAYCDYGRVDTAARRSAWQQVRAAHPAKHQ
ncbi:MAG TPA: hypothetical protein PKA05_14020 [Roseiflexaceae bacterium]|nr:hypothetical protein [Roseiflexaceae bacterium]HMP41494.1 hypothetical protein [Roseiflexaceae bacterium]